MNSDTLSKTVFVIGTGALSKSIVDAISNSNLMDLRIVIFSRDHSKSSWLATIGHCRSLNTGNRQSFVPVAIDWKSDELLVHEIGLYTPTLIINTSSIQSMWNLRESNKWSRLVIDAGYGLTLPLQVELSLRVAKAIAVAQSEPLFVNCCYPDLVNVLINKTGFKTFSGIGNIGIVDSLLHEKAPNLEYFLLANHFHVQQLSKPPADRVSYPLLWINNQLSDSQERFNQITIQNDPSLNSITAMTCVKLMSSLLFGTPSRHHLPGVNGLPGGYPVMFQHGSLHHLGLESMSLNSQTSWNVETLCKDGVSLTNQAVYFSEACVDSLKKYNTDLAKGFRFEDTMDATREMLRLRESLMKCG